jgi:hypothetical protein
MSLDGFLTFLSILIAGIAIMPSTARLRLLLHRTLISMISATCLLLVVWLLVFVGKKSGLSRSFPSAFPGQIEATTSFEVSANEWAFFIVLSWLAVFFYVAFFLKPTANSLPLLSNLTREMLERLKYVQVIDLLHLNLDLVERALNGELGLRRWLRNLHPSASSRNNCLVDPYDTATLKPGHVPKNCLHIFLSKKISNLSRFAPATENQQIAAQDIFKQINNSPEFLKQLAVYRPETAVKILGWRATLTSDFSEGFLLSALENKNSALYLELKNNQYIHGSKYYIQSENVILSFLFSDAKAAEKLEVYRPVGEHLIRVVTDFEDSKYSTYLNGPIRQFEEVEKWKDEAFIVIRFFDIMITSAAHQGITWHMWAPYFYYFTKNFEEVYSAGHVGEFESSEAETRLEFLLHEVFSTLCSWVTMVNDLPKQSPNIVFPTTEKLSLDSSPFTPIHSTITLSAITTLGQSFSVICLSEKIRGEFVASIFSMIIHCILSVRRKEITPSVKFLLINSIISAGGLSRENELHIKLRDLWGNLDAEDKFRLPEFSEALDRAR